MFDGFEVVSLFATVLLLNLIIVDAKVHWYVGCLPQTGYTLSHLDFLPANTTSDTNRIQGVLLLADWALIAVAAFFVTIHDSNPDSVA